MIHNKCKYTPQLAKNSMQRVVVFTKLGKKLKKCTFLAQIFFEASINFINSGIYQ